MSLEAWPGIFAYLELLLLPSRERLSLSLPASWLAWSSTLWEFSRQEHSGVRLEISFIITSVEGDSGIYWIASLPSRRKASKL